MREMADLVGRTAERAALQHSHASSEAELVAVYGRRRVGKTFLVREHFGESIVFELTGMHGVSVRQQLENFAASLRMLGRAPFASPPPRDWFEAFRMLMNHLELGRGARKRVLFFDELPWLSARRSGFLPAFEHFWNSWAVKRRDLVVVVCGSAASWMIARVVRARGGLHNRVTRQLRLDPFTLGEARAFLHSRGLEPANYHMLELYMALGGIPHYLKEVRRGESAAQTIDRACFSNEGLLRDEMSVLFRSLFEHAERHEHVVQALASHPRGLTRTELLEATDMSSGGGTTTLLEELEASGFVMRVRQFDREIKDAVLRLADEYSLFHAKWIAKHRGRAAHTWTNLRSTPAWRAWSGAAFETICLKHAAQLKRALGIEGVETVQSAWMHRAVDRSDIGGQIDLLIDRRDGCINLCEMKFSEADFVIDKRYATDLRTRRETFRRVTGTRKTLLTTFVTTFGVRRNAWHDELVSKSVEMDALFE